MRKTRNFCDKPGNGKTFFCQYQRNAPCTEAQFKNFTVFAVLTAKQALCQQTHDVYYTNSRYSITQIA